MRQIQQHVEHEDFSEGDFVFVKTEFGKEFTGVVEKSMPGALYVNGYIVRPFQDFVVAHNQVT